MSIASAKTPFTPTVKKFLDLCESPAISPVWSDFKNCIPDDLGWNDNKITSINNCVLRDDHTNNNIINGIKSNIKKTPNNANTQYILNESFTPCKTDMQ